MGWQAVIFDQWINQKHGVNRYLSTNPDVYRNVTQIWFDVGTPQNGVRGSAKNDSAPSAFSILSNSNTDQLTQT